jgi:hypothetical protein
MVPNSIRTPCRGGGPIARSYLLLGSNSPFAVSNQQKKIIKALTIVGKHGQEVMKDPLVLRIATVMWYWLRTF